MRRAERSAIQCAADKRTPGCHLSPGIVRPVDVREDFHIWLDPAMVVEVLSRLQ